MFGWRRRGYALKPDRRWAYACPTMYGNSSSVRSRQTDLHFRLDESVQRHLDAPWRAPVHEPTRQVLAPLLAELVSTVQPIILDSGCGDGSSTLRLAYRYPDALVVGLDRSALRLQRLAPEGWLRRGNLRLYRAEVAEAWRLLDQAGVRLAGHFLLYPNPWPKKTHLHRRWHGHPVFPSLLALGGLLELRSNWPIYVREFRRALELAGRASMVDTVADPGAALTPFERKYADSGHELWRLRSYLGGRRGQP